MGEQSFFARWSWFIEWMTPSRATLKWVKKVIYQGRSKYQDIAVVEIDGEGKTLILDGKTQSSESDERIYHEALVHPAMMLAGSHERVLILGGGEGATAREVLKYDRVKEVVMVDIDEMVVEVSKRYLKEWHEGSFEDPRLKLVIDDAWNYVKSSLDRGDKFNVIICDLVDPEPGGPATRLYTVEFYNMIKRLLADDGAMVTQATSISHTTAVHAVIRRTIESVFGEDNVASYGVYVPSFDSYWGFIVASRRFKPEVLANPDFVESRVKELLGGWDKLATLDYQSIIHMFSIPRIYRRVIESVREVSTLEKPVVMPA